jgi:hypothetical protein
MVPAQTLPDGWESLAPQPGARYSAARRPRFVNADAGLAVEVTLDDDGPEYRADVLCSGQWVPILGDATHEEVLDGAYRFMQSVD